jgi:hypothetical protein
LKIDVTIDATDEDLARLFGSNQAMSEVVGRILNMCANYREALTATHRDLSRFSGGLRLSGLSYLAERTDSIAKRVEAALE